jgi:hypothetical protein
MNTQELEAAPGRVLSSIAPQERLLVDSIRFPMLRTLCADIGIRVGESVVALVVTPRVLLLRNHAGHAVRLDAEWARFIGVSECADAREAVAAN